MPPLARHEAGPGPRQASVSPPGGSVDCHAHIFGPYRHYPLTSERTYTPPEALLPDYLRVLDSLSIERAVLVQPSVYGTDNRLLIGALRVCGERLRGVAVVSPEVTDAALDAMHRAGVRGVRVNLLFRGGISFDAALALAERIARLGWHLELLADLGRARRLIGALARLPVPVVIDHMGHMAVRAAGEPHGVGDLIALLRSADAWVKLSGPYRISAANRLPYPDVVPLARALVEAAPERCIWGSDWPHPAIPGPAPEAGPLLDLLELWAPEDEVRARILRDNPARLYGFAPRP